MARLPLVMVEMNLIYAAAAYPFGKLSDRMSHTKLLAWRLVVLIASDVLLANAQHWGMVITSVALRGVHMGMTQGLLATMVASTASSDLRGTAFGVFNLASGVAMLAASAVAGLLWDAYGSSMTFWLAEHSPCFVSLGWRAAGLGVAAFPPCHRLDRSSTLPNT
jgi:MFS family permease